MHQYNVGATFGRIATGIAGPFLENEREYLYLLIDMDYITKLPEVYAIPNQEASTEANALVTNFFCRFGLLKKLHKDQGRNLES
jgi:hypothetical protein